MGIRFHCPNGHKLNVKAFLAGKKGVCPDCGVKVRIPDRSEPGLDSGVDEGKSAAQPQAAPQPAVAAAPATARPAPAPRPMPAPAPAVAVQPAVMPLAAVRPAVVAPMPAAPLPPPVPPTARLPGAPADPIAENPLATWFVRPPSGGQFGPARGEVMRKWLTEGRVTSDSLVWREGWADWLPATEVFPSLGKPTPPLFNSVAPSASKPSPITLPKKSSGNLGALLLIILAVVCVGLTAVLGYVVFAGGFSST